MLIASEDSEFELLYFSFFSSSMNEACNLFFYLNLGIQVKKICLLYDCITANLTHKWVKIHHGIKGICYPGEWKNRKVPQTVVERKYSQIMLSDTNSILPFCALSATVQNPISR